ncbi:MAG: indole-3-glycerol-phosphate synthase [bacterium]
MTDNILDEIVEQKRDTLQQQKQDESLASLQSRLSQPVQAQFQDALQAEDTLSLIAEIKPEAPSSGTITNLPAVEIATVYQEEAPAAVSVLTDEPYFNQGLQELRRVQSVLTKPILRKDFIIDEYQVYQSAVFGADAILLIASILTPDQMKYLHQVAEDLGLDVLVEIHSREEFKSLPFRPSLLGINNRTLEGDFSTDLFVTEQLVEEIPDSVTLVSESGIHSREDVERLSQLETLDAILVGTSLLKDHSTPDDIRRKIRGLMAKEEK